MLRPLIALAHIFYVGSGFIVRPSTAAAASQGVLWMNPGSSTRRMSARCEISAARAGNVPTIFFNAFLWLLTRFMSSSSKNFSRLL